jgi:hypothetical protein
MFNKAVSQSAGCLAKDVWPNTLQILQNYMATLFQTIPVNLFVVTSSYLQCRCRNSAGHQKYIFASQLFKINPNVISYIFQALEQDIYAPEHVLFRCQPKKLCILPIVLRYSFSMSYTNCYWCVIIALCLPQNAPLILFYKRIYSFSSQC